MSRIAKHILSQDNFPNSAVKDAPSTLAISLRLDDLVPDSTGAVVIQGGSEHLEIAIEDVQDVLSRGIASDGMRSEHFDVSGYDYVIFANGVTLYHPAGEVAVTFKPPVRREKKAPAGSLTLTELLDRELRQGHPMKRLLSSGKPAN